MQEKRARRATRTFSSQNPTARAWHYDFRSGSHAQDVYKPTSKAPRRYGTTGPLVHVGHSKRVA